MIILKKYLTILETLANSEVPLNIREISRKIKIPKSTLYRHLANLSKMDLIEYDAANDTYALGVYLVRLGQIAARRLNIYRCAYPFMEDLAKKTGETTVLTVKKENKALVIEVVDSGRTGMKYAMNRGDLLPLYCCAITRPLMISLSEEEINSILRNDPPRSFTPYTITDPKIIKEEINKVKRQGYSFSNQELTIGAKGVGAPIWDYSGKVIAALSIVGPVHNFSEKKVGAFIKLLKKATDECSLKMGFTLKKGN